MNNVIIYLYAYEWCINALGKKCVSNSSIKVSQQEKTLKNILNWKQVTWCWIVEWGGLYWRFWLCPHLIYIQKLCWKSRRKRNKEIVTLFDFELSGCTLSSDKEQTSCLQWCLVLNCDFSHNVSTHNYFLHRIKFFLTYFW